MSCIVDKKRKIPGYYPTTKKLFTSTSLKGRRDSRKELIKDGPAKGLPLVLLEKVKNRDHEMAELARKIFKAKLVNMIKIIHCHFVMCPKPVPIKILIDRCMNSYASRHSTYISSLDVEKLINSVVGLLPEWITICVVRNTKFAKILNFSKTLAQLEQQISLINN